MNSKRTKDLTKVTIVGGKPAPVEQVVQSPAEIDIPISFDDWWIQIQNKYNLNPALKKSVQKHFEARGFIGDHKKFNAGLRDFGYRT